MRDDLAEHGGDVDRVFKAGRPMVGLARNPQGGAEAGRARRPTGPVLHLRSEPRTRTGRSPCRAHLALALNSLSLIQPRRHDAGNATQLDISFTPPPRTKTGGLCAARIMVFNRSSRPADRCLGLLQGRRGDSSTEQDRLGRIDGSDHDAKVPLCVPWAVPVWSHDSVIVPAQAITTLWPPTFFGHSRKDADPDVLSTAVLCCLTGALIGDGGHVRFL